MAAPEVLASADGVVAVPGCVVGVGEVTQLLSMAQQGDHSACESLWTLIYEDLRRMARAVLHGGANPQMPGDATLVHELYLRLTRAETPTKWDNRRHFFGSMARAMGQVVIDHGRTARRLKRGGGATPRVLHSEVAAVESFDDMMELATSELPDALEKLRVHAPMAADVVWLRAIAGLSVAQTAEILGCSKRTVDNYRLFAHAWLRRELGSQQ